MRPEDVVVSDLFCRLRSGAEATECTNRCEHQDKILQKAEPVRHLRGCQEFRRTGSNFAIQCEGRGVLRTVLLENVSSCLSKLNNCLSVLASAFCANITRDFGSARAS